MSASRVFQDGRSGRWSIILLISQLPFRSWPTDLLSSPPNLQHKHRRDQRTQPPQTSRGVLENSRHARGGKTKKETNKKVSAVNSSSTDQQQSSSLLLLEHLINRKFCPIPQPRKAGSEKIIRITLPLLEIFCSRTKKNHWRQFLRAHLSLLYLLYGQF